VARRRARLRRPRAGEGGPWQLGGAFASLLAVVGGVAWAASALVVKLLQRREHVDVLYLTTWQMAFGSVPLIVIAALTYTGGPEWTSAFVGGLTYTVVLANTVAWVLWLYALRSLSAGASHLPRTRSPTCGR